MRKAIEDYNMIQQGDRIAIGVSGGKDSLALLYCMKELQKFYPKRFELVAITLSLGNEGFDTDSLIEIYNRLDIQYHIEQTQISKIVFDVRKEKNPCSLCSNMKRGAVHNTAKKLGCNKVAFGHHKDDVVETFLLALLYEGRIHTFSPVTYLDRKDITLIRPLIYINEDMIQTYIENANIMPIPSGCREDGRTKRSDIKQVLSTLMKENKYIKDNIFGAIQRSKVNGWHPPL
ncbi:MAG TPA: ATP-binding protein [Thermoclostridium sp.]|nr:ATP-binding protein [Thermoclostridium sp.]